MIQIKHLSKSFKRNHVLFNDLNLTINHGDRLALIGPSGSGKSMLLRYILATQRPDSGSVYVDGLNVFSLNQSDLFELRLKMGMLFQSAALFDSLTVEENIAFPLVENYGIQLGQTIKKVNYVLELVGLEGVNHQYPYQLSGGQKKRVAMARAIITEPKYLLYDEPTAGLDPIATTNIENVIIRINAVLNTTTIVVSHERSTILRTSEKIVMIHNNALLDQETPDTILTTPNTVIKDFMKG